MKLQQILILSRHNMRTPTIGEQEFTKQVPDFPWQKWDVDPGNLTLQGIILETGLGHYFRKYLAQQELFSQASTYEENSLRFYANCTQRTLATAKAFATGCFPMANIAVEQHLAGTHGDPVFASDLSKVDSDFVKQVQDEIYEKLGTPQEIMENLKPNFQAMFKVLGIENSSFAKNILEELSQEGFHITLEANFFPYLNKVLQLANGLAYALLEHYYSGAKPTITLAEITALYPLKDFYDGVTFGTPAIGKQGAQPLLQVIYDELTHPQRQLTFLAGHDTNLNNIIAALKLEPFTLPNSIETRTPLGSKIIIEKYKDDHNGEYGKIYYLYLSHQQLANLDYFHKHPQPLTIDLNLPGLTKAKGLYLWDDLINYIHATIE